MPRKVLAAERAQFWRLYKAGHTIKEASARAGFSESYGKGLIRNGRGDNSTPASRPGRFEAEEIDLRPKRPYELSAVAADCLEDFGRFRARYFGSLSVPWQEEAAAIVLKHLDSDDDSYGVINAPQGAGKTRLFTHDIPTWLTVRDRSIRGCLLSGTLQIAERMTSNLRTTFSRKTPARAAERWKRRGMAMDAEATLIEDYGRFKPIVPGVMWTRAEFSVEQFWTEAELADMAEYEGQGQDKESTWAAFSPDAQIMSLRFDFMNCDDMHREKHLRNPNVMDDLFNWWEVEAESRLDPGGLLLVTMQRLGANDISRHLLDKVDPTFEIDIDHPEQGPRQYFHVVFKAHYDDRCQGDHSFDAAPYPDGCMLDPRRLTDQKQKAKKTAGTYEIVYQQEDVDPAAQLVRQSWIDGGLDPFDSVHYPGCWDVERAAGELPVIQPGAVRYMCVDPSPTKYWAVQDWVYVPQSGDLAGDPGDLTGLRVLVDVERVRMGANELLDWSNDYQSWTGLLDEWVLRAKNQGLPVGTLVFEKNAAQRWALQYEHFRRWQMSRGVQVIQHETMANKLDPVLGVEATLPGVYKTGRVRLPGKGIMSRTQANYLVKEVVHWGQYATNDQPMAQWFGEFHLPSLFAASRTIGSVYHDIPSWMRPAPKVHPLFRRVAS